VLKDPQTDFTFLPLVSFLTFPSASCVACRLKPFACIKFRMSGRWVLVLWISGFRHCKLVKGYHAFGLTYCLHLKDIFIIVILWCMCDRASYMKITRGTNLMQQLWIYYHKYLYMFRASICPSSGVQVVCYCICCSALGVVAVVLRSRCVILYTVCKYRIQTYTQFTRLHTSFLGPQPQHLVLNTVCSNIVILLGTDFISQILYLKFI
jgi:hypothetical protein